MTAEKAVKVIMSCFALHNLAKKLNLPDFPGTMNVTFCS